MNCQQSTLMPGTMLSRYLDSLNSRVQQGQKLTIKASLICNIINQQDTHRTPIISRCNRPKSLLARRIPNLQLHPLAIQFNGSNLEVDSDCGDEGRRETIFAES
jgi:hypothetical protein